MQLLLILLFGGVCSYFGPWWAIAPVCFVVWFFLPEDSVSAFWKSAFIGIILWAAYSVYLILGDGTYLATKVAGIFTAGVPILADIPAIALVLIIAACVVGPISGFSGLAGVKLRHLIRPPRRI